MQREDIAIGTCDGTGAIINVCLGFIPRRVEVYNIEDAGSLFPHIEWMKGMSLVTAMAEGVKWYTGTVYQEVGLLAATYGVKEYAGGDLIHWDATDARWENAAAAAVPEVYVDGHFEKTATSASYRCYGDVADPQRSGAVLATSPGFTLAADGDVNVDGEQIIWIAYR